MSYFPYGRFADDPLDNRGALYPQDVAERARRHQPDMRPKAGPVTVRWDFTIPPAFTNHLSMVAANAAAEACHARIDSDEACMRVNRAVTEAACEWINERSGSL